MKTYSFWLQLVSSRQLDKYEPVQVGKLGQSNLIVKKPNLYTLWLFSTRNYLQSIDIYVLVMNIVFFLFTLKAS